MNGVASPAIRSTPVWAVTNLQLEIAYAALTLILLALNLGGAVRLLYAPAALLVALRLSTTSTPDYVSFTVWLWALSPLVRRIADLQAGWVDANPILLAPYLVSAAPAARAVAKVLVDPARAIALPRNPGMFLLAAFGIATGVPLGFALGWPGATLETLNWIVPVVFGAYLAACPREVAAIEASLASTFTGLAVVVGGYGIFQFFNLPNWDANWMQNSDMKSIGTAESLAVRVFSTMHSPGVLAFFILVPIALWLARPRLRGLVPLCLACITLLLSQVRTAWAAFAVAAILLVLSMRLATGIRLVLLVLFGALTVAPFLQLPDVSERINARIETLGDVPGYDNSALARTEGYSLALDYVAAHPLGAGVGANPPQLDVIGTRDSAVIATFVQFGIVGAVVYALGVVLLGYRLSKDFAHAATFETRALSAAAFGMLCTFPLGVPTMAQPGIVVWMIGGLAAARTAWPAGERR